MKVLMIGNPDSIYIKNLCEHVFNTDTYSVAILNRSPSGYIGRYSEFYSDKSIAIITPSKSMKSFLSVPFISGLLLKMWLHHVACRRAKYDLCFIEYAAKESCDYVVKTKKQYGRIILSYWGSDLLRANKITEKAQKRVGALSSIITFESNNMRESFKGKFGDKYNDRLYVIPFPMPNLDSIYCKQNDGAERIRIAIGYSASEAQHHIQILDSIALLDKTVKNRIKLCMLMSYGGSKEYIEKVRLSAEKAGTEFEIMEHFLSPNEMAEYSESIDIYIHGIETDAFSASMLEMIVGGAVVIKGEWLKYDELDNIGVSLIDIGSYSQVGAVIESIIEDYPNRQKLAALYSEKVKKKYATQTVKQQYQELIGIE